MIFDIAELAGPRAAIRYGIVPCPLGKLLIAGTKRGVCALGLADTEAPMRQFLAHEHPTAAITRDDAGLEHWSRPIVRYLAGKQVDLDLPMDVRGTLFQRRVWSELCKIPYGQVTRYRELAERLDKPSAVRAIARACATNPVSILIPCHRVIRVDGALAGYRWGLERKRALLDMEKDHIRRGQK